MSESVYQPNQVLTPRWHEDSLRIFCEVLRKYIKFLMPHDLEGNKLIHDEIRRVKAYKEHIEKVLGNDDFSLRELVMTASEYGLLLDLLWKEHSALNEELREKNSQIFVEGALQGLEGKIEEISNILSTEIMQKVPRRKALVPSLKEVSTKSTTGDTTYYSQTILGNVYGIAINSNLGNNIEVKNKRSQAYETLKEITELVRAIESNEIAKQDIYADIQTIQSQLAKKTPSKSIIQGALDSLGALANISQISDFFIQNIQPKLGLLHQIMEKLAD